MIIKITQTFSRFKKKFEFETDNSFSQCETHKGLHSQTITMPYGDSTILGVPAFCAWYNYIPFRHFFKKHCLRDAVVLYKNDIKYGNIVFSRHGFMKSYYIITMESGERFICYYCTKGSFDYFSIYHNDKQIALIEKFLNSFNQAYRYKLYILDDYDTFADIFSFFVLYHSSFRNGTSDHFSIGLFMASNIGERSVSGRAYTFSRYNDKYTPEWQEKNFPNENFFGKTNRFS